MPTTRRQTAIAEGKIVPDEHDEHQEHHEKKPRRHSTAAHKGHPHKTKAEHENGHPMDEDVKPPDVKAEDHVAGDKREHTKEENKQEEPPAKVQKVEVGAEGIYKPGTIERGHIYFFYRPRVEHEEAQSIEDVQHFHMLLIPRPPDFLVSDSPVETSEKKEDDVKAEDAENMKVLAPGADAVPAPEPTKFKKKFYRLITVGKKRLPDPDSPGTGGSKRKEMFWATVTAVGDDLSQLAEGLGEKTYETKTRGTRHIAPSRLAARGGYALVNGKTRTRSDRETHFGYHVSHPKPEDMGDVQEELGIYPASSFVLQVRNPLAPPQGPIQLHSTPADYPEWIMRGVFGASDGGEKHAKGREDFGLRFASCETPELLNYKNAQILLIAAREGEEGLEKSLGEGRGVALSEVEQKEGHESIRQVFEELKLDISKFPAEPLEGSWA
ncbi:hypothetical protein BDN70DRAFT_880182 [Pholiota conissans]|uniref:Uncharacterized protein n=1 Tax=Pholiota conissans TaxID=109636 RepID=A0A9P5Z0V7_9AGAR|nr:hypothetical protein BDN70DRAFT_880182 [Pholiota conissans]